MLTSDLKLLTTLTIQVKHHQLLKDPTSHTVLDTFDYVEGYIDPTFTAHQTLAWIVGEAVLQLSTFIKLPFDVRELADTLQCEFDGLHAILMKQQSGEKLLDLGEVVELFIAILAAGLPPI